MGGRADTPTTFQECKITFFFLTIVLFRLLESCLVPLPTYLQFRGSIRRDI